jgi:hypothetical protein
MTKNKFLMILSILLVLTVAFFAAKWMMGQGKKISSRSAAVQKAAKKISQIRVKTVSLPEKSPMLRPEGAEMAIILDDWGPNAALVNEAVAIGRPLTLSILPNLRYSRRIAEAAKAHGLGVMLHMPMQPKGKRQPAEPHTILTTTPDKEIVKYLDEALASVPFVEGVNNHQGSAATSDERVMRTVLSYLKKKGLFFVDSRVIATSVGSRVAREVGISFGKRDFFIDNQPVVDAIIERLREAQRVALKNGRVVVIGHDKRATLEAIKRMVPEFDKSGVKLVLAREIVE